MYPTTSPARSPSPKHGIAYRLIRRLRPVVSIWFHQHLNLVDESGGNATIERRFATRVTFGSLDSHANPEVLPCGKTTRSPAPPSWLNSQQDTYNLPPPRDSRTQSPPSPLRSGDTPRTHTHSALLRRKDIHEEANAPPLHTRDGLRGARRCHRVRRRLPCIRATRGACDAAGVELQRPGRQPVASLLPGTRYVYTGVKDGKPSRDVLTVTHETKTIDGVPCVVVHDRLYLHGRLGERTTDWYSQDEKGNVWYFGENTAELDVHGHVTSTAGTWTAGLNGAQPGIEHAGPPPRRPVRTAGVLQGGQAEYHYKVIGLFGTVAPAGTANTLLTQESTPLEPGVLDHKMYVRGIGTVLEQTEKGGNERNELRHQGRVDNPTARRAGSSSGTDLCS